MLSLWAWGLVIKKILKRIGLGLVGIIVLLLVWGVARSPRLIDVERYDVAIPGLPTAWQGQRIAFIADWQIGMWLNNTDTVRRIVARLAEERPAAVLIGGDFVYGASDDTEEDAGEATAIARMVSQAGIPTYAVLGNHDYGIVWQSDPKQAQRAQVVRAGLEGVGVRVLNNQAVPLPLPGGANTAGNGNPLYFVGIGPNWPNEDQPAAAVAQVPAGAPRVVFMHNPISYENIPANTAPLAIAGHTHGGQVRIPFTPDWSWVSLVKGRKVPIDGWITNFGQPGNRLYINRGIGFSLVPIRINCLPEITVFTLQGGG